jgi:hypothetical protein
VEKFLLLPEVTGEVTPAELARVPAELRAPPAAIPQPDATIELVRLSFLRFGLKFVG